MLIDLFCQYWLFFFSSCRDFQERHWSTFWDLLLFWKFALLFITTNEKPTDLQLDWFDPITDLQRGWNDVVDLVQVCSVLESLQREYSRDEDWCCTDKATGTDDKGAYIQQLINKHQEQKEAFLKVYTLPAHISSIIIVGLARLCSITFSCNSYLLSLYIAMGGCWVNWK